MAKLNENFNGGKTSANKELRISSGYVPKPGTRSFRKADIEALLFELNQLHEAGLEQLELWKADDRATNIPKLQAAISEIAWAIASLQAAQKQLSSFLKHQRAF